MAKSVSAVCWTFSSSSRERWARLTAARFDVVSATRDIPHHMHVRTKPCYLRMQSINRGRLFPSPGDTEAEAVGRSQHWASCGRPEHSALGLRAPKSFCTQPGPGTQVHREGKSETIGRRGQGRHDSAQLPLAPRETEDIAAILLSPKSGQPTAALPTTEEPGFNMPSSTRYPAPTQRPTFGSNKYKATQKIALEEAIATHVYNATQTLPPAAGTAELPYVNVDYVADVKDRLTNVETRVKSMDEAGVALTVISLTMPGIEGIFEAAKAVETARKVNDEIHQLYLSGPHKDRFRAFACVAMQDPKAAAVEAERCVKELGFIGILINGFSNIGDENTVQYLDEEQCEPFWAKLEELQVPLYLHPRIPPPNQMRAYKGYEFLAGSPWGFGTETATHSIRLMISGLFDRHPSVKIILGHCGEGIPFSLHRIDHRLRHFQDKYIKCQHPLQHYWENNFFITTAGVSSDGAFFETLRVVGEDRLMWSVDYPYEDYDEIGQWFDKLELSENTRAKIGWENARRLLKIG